jgi:integrase
VREGEAVTLGDGTRVRRGEQWRARGVVDGQRVQTYGRTPEEALEKYDQRKAELRKGYYASPGGRTVDDVFAAYLDDARARGLRPSTMDYYRQARDRYTPEWLLATKLKQLRPEDWRRAQSALHARGLAANTIRNTRVLWNAALVFAVQNEWLGRNPLDAVKAPKRVRPTLRWPTTDEQEALLDAAEAAGDTLAALWRLGASGGLRPGELLGLRWEDLDLEVGTVLVRRSLSKLPGQAPTLGPTKTAVPRPPMALDARTVEALRAHKAAQNEQRLQLGPEYEDFGLVFCQPTGAPLLPRTAADRFKQALARAGLPATIRFYDLRHGNATAMLTAGVHEKVAASRLGHTSTALFHDTYAHVQPSVDRAAADAVGAVLSRRRAGGAAAR